MKPNTYYEHYKGGIYKLLYVATHSEDQSRVVVYEDAKGQVWVRPENMWFEIVNGVRRFEPLGLVDGKTKFFLAQQQHRYRQQ